MTARQFIDAELKELRERAIRLLTMGPYGGPNHEFLEFVDAVTNFREKIVMAPRHMK